MFWPLACCLPTFTIEKLIINLHIELLQFEMIPVMILFLFFFFVEDEGPCPEYVIVMCNGHIFKMDDLFDENGEEVGALEIQR